MAQNLPNLDRFGSIITIWVKPEDVNKYFAALKPAFEKAIKEPQCTYLEVFLDPTEPGKVVMVENWDVSPQWFYANQLTKDYYKPYFAASKPLMVKPRDVKILQRVGQPYIVSKPANIK